MKKLTKKQKTILKHWVVGLLSLALVIVGATVLWAASLPIPDFAAFDQRQVTQSTKIYDRTGEILLYNMGENLRRTVVSGDQINRHVKNAAVAIEDSNFYYHHGVEPSAILRAFLVNVSSFSASQGGSTITQQVIKNALLTREKSLTRKLKEASLALKLERVMSKDDILTLYLNESPYGGNIYGVEEASQTFFGKQAINLSLAESAYLAALPQAPTRYSPYGNHKNELEVRKNLVLSRMSELNFITKEEEAEAKKEQVKFLPQENFGIKAPHFVFFVRAYLEEKYGKELVDRGGLKVITTLDFEMQKKTEEIVKEFAPINEKNFNAHNMGVVATDPKSGKILVMVGSRDYFEKGNDGNYNVTLAHRQPGSSFKPFVYAAAFRKGYTPDTVFFDLPTQFQTSCSPVVSPASNLPSTSLGASQCYAPGNYDGLFRGPMTARDALAQSINIPSIEVLYLAGLRDSINLAQDMGITSLSNAAQYGLTLVLGGGEVSPLEMTNAYAVFANGGTFHPYYAVEQVVDSQGNVLEQAVPNQGERVLDSEVANSISDILSDNVARLPAYGSDSPLNFTDWGDVAAKTGTTNNYRDMWTVGYSPEIALGIWVGNNDNSSMVKRVAGLVVAPMWRKIFLAVAADLPRTPFGRPTYAYKDDPTIKPILRGIWQGGNTYTIDTISGKLATQYTPKETRKEVAVGDVHSILHWLDKDEPGGPQPGSPEQDPQYPFWETPIKLWAATNGYTQSFGSSTTVTNKPTEYDNIHGPQFAPTINITSPIAGNSYSQNDRLLVSWSASPKSYPIASTEIYLGDTFVAKVLAPSTSYSFIPASLQGATPDNPIGNTLRFVVRDTIYNSSEATTNLTLTQ